MAREIVSPSDPGWREMVMTAIPRLRHSKMCFACLHVLKSWVVLFVDRVAHAHLRVPPSTPAPASSASAARAASTASCHPAVRRARLGPLRVGPVRQGQKFNLSAAGYVPAEAYSSGQDVLRVPMLPRLDGHVVDAASGKPVAGAQVSVANQVLTTDAGGGYQLPRRPAD